jgi:aerotaxis receptor
VLGLIDKKISLFSVGSQHEKWRDFEVPDSETASEVEMVENFPVTQQEYDYPSENILVSTTDLQGRITHCNHAFEATSGFGYEELIGQPHSMVRHPDVPPEAFYDLWATVGRGRPWTGIVKNRRKNGDHYWVVANVTPIMQGGKPKAYMSVRYKPSRAQISAAEALYAKLDAQRKSGRHTFKLHAGGMRSLGWRDGFGKLHRLTLTQRLGIAIGVLGGVTMAIEAIGLSAMATLGAEAAWLLVGGAALLFWFHKQFTVCLNEIDRFAGDLAGCNLTTTLDPVQVGPFTSIARRLSQIQMNLHATIGDVRTEIEEITQMTEEVSRSSQDLSARTEAQANSLETTASSMEQLASTVRQTADMAEQVSQQSAQSTQVAQLGGAAVQSVGASMRAIETSSKKVGEIIAVIEGIAFQTNILALNAAVEAARAGEQGRGFAVVATEVRSLAHRSSTAAKEIRQLIGASVQQVAEGSHQMQDAGRTMHEVVDSVAQVSALIHQISSATKEQSIGIAQVNQSVNQLDTTTQQNAALGEESAAAATALNQSTASLRRSVDVFRLP